MTQRRRRIGVLPFLLVFLMLFTVLVGCAPAAPGEQAPAQPAEPAQQVAAAGEGETVTITYWSHSHEPRDKLDSEMIEKFMKENPNIKVEWEVFPEQFETKLTTAMASGTGPTMFNLSWRWSFPIMDGGLVVPVDAKAMGYKSVEEFENIWVEGIIDGFKHKGTLYGVPTEISNYAMFLNKKLFEEAGLTEADYPETWEDVVEVSRKLQKEEEGVITQRGFDFTYGGKPSDYTSDQLSWLGMVHQYEGEIIGPDGKAQVNTEPFKKVLGFMHDYVCELGLGHPELEGANTGFHEGNVAMTLVGSWYGAMVQEQNPEVWENHTVIPFPQFKNRKQDSGAEIYAYGFLVNADATPAQQEAAWKLIGYITQHPEEYLHNTGLLRPTKELAASSALQNVKSVHNMQVFLEDASKSEYYLLHPKMVEIYQALREAQHKVTLECGDVDAALEEANSRIDEILAQE